MGTGSLGVGNKMGFHGDREGRCSVLYEFSWGQGG